ncbi:hypothetical protein TI05_16625 [Achromatium sp. WMS3]|nr:hypothetical protein TI05_16625 [Achromatium sp. WMS3]
MLVIGLTGGIGSGKSTAAKHFAALGAYVIDADQIAHKLVAPGQKTLELIVNAFGSQILTANGNLNRAILRQLVFSNMDAKTRLEDILHPQIYIAIQNEISKIKEFKDTVPYIIIMVPLLLETQQTNLCQRILVIDIPESIQIERVQQRDGHTLTQIQAIMNNQWHRAKRLASADDIIDNSTDLISLIAQIDKLHTYYMSLS